MKKIVLIMKDGSRVDFDKLVGCDHNKTLDDAKLSSFAATAMKVDPEIESFELEEIS